MKEYEERKGRRTLGIWRRKGSEEAVGRDWVRGREGRVEMLSVSAEDAGGAGGGGKKGSITKTEKAIIIIKRKHHKCTKTELKPPTHGTTIWHQEVH